MPPTQFQYVDVEALVDCLLTLFPKAQICSHFKKCSTFFPLHACLLLNICTQAYLNSEIRRLKNYRQSKDTGAEIYPSQILFWKTVI